MSKLRMFYLLMSLIGAMVPMIFIWGWLQSGGELLELISAWIANGGSTGMIWDLLLYTVVFSVFVISECIARRDYFPLVALPVTVMIGLSSGLPLYLFLRTRMRT